MAIAETIKVYWLCVVSGLLILLGVLGWLVLRGMNKKIQGMDNRGKDFQGDAQGLLADMKEVAATNIRALNVEVASARTEYEKALYAQGGSLSKELRAVEKRVAALEPRTKTTAADSSKKEVTRPRPLVPGVAKRSKGAKQRGKK